MALKRVAKFDWEKLLAKVDSSDVKRSINILRAKANEITATSAKFSSKPEPIEFGAYKNKLKFTSAAVDALEAAYNSKSLPVYHAALPSFEAKKREITLSVVRDIVESTKLDLEQLTRQLDEFENVRISKTTTVDDLLQRFPQFAREIEQDLKNHKWAGSN